MDVIGDGYDLSVRTGSIDVRAGLMVERLGSHRMIVCASPDYLAAYDTPRRLEYLRSHSAVVYARPGWNYAWLFQDDKGARVEVSPPHRVRLDDLAAVTEAAVAGAGLAWVPSWLARPHIEAGRLVEVLEDRPCFTFANYALWPEAKHTPLKVRIALDLLAAEIPKQLDPKRL